MIFWYDGNLSHKISDCVICFFVRQISSRTKFGATGTYRTKILNFHELVSTHCNILPPTQFDNTPPPPTPSEQHTTTTQHKNNINDVFEIANLGFLNFNC